MNDGDWICADSNCGNINFARRLSCYRCKKDRPDGPYKKKLGTEIGKTAAEKSRGLFNADDWQCNKCANVNWARRVTCNVCNSPRFGEEEARTGYGGGYNERGVVEYRRRDSSSDDEYDEFGRKKRKRKSDPQEKVGITEGPVPRKFPRTMQRIEKMNGTDHLASNIINKKSTHKTNGSLSDGSVCDLPPISKDAFRRPQFQRHTDTYRQNKMYPNYKTSDIHSYKRYPKLENGNKTESYVTNEEIKHSNKILVSEDKNLESFNCKPYEKCTGEKSSNIEFKQKIYENKSSNNTFKERDKKEVSSVEKEKNVHFRMRFSSGEKEHTTGSSGYETGTKKSKQDNISALYQPTVKSFQPENSTLSRNKSVVDTINVTDPLDDPELKYSIEEKVRIAAFAIAYNNCKISIDKFQSYYHKPGPDFQTIFSWAKKLLNKGCLVHTDIKQNTLLNTNNNTVKVCTKVLPNPEEIHINFESDKDCVDSPLKMSIGHRSVSCETVVISDNENEVQATVSSVGTRDDRDTNVRSHSSLSNHQTFSSPHDSNNSDYHDSDAEQIGSKKTSCKSVISNKSTPVKCRSAHTDSDSDSVSVDSDEGDFLSRVYEKGKILRRRPQRRPQVTAVNTNNVTDNIQSFTGYSTKQIDNSPLVTGNIYTPNTRNMKAKIRETISHDTDSCSIEYVPTKLGSTAKNNYQLFKDNIRRKGYWAKGNSGTNQSNSCLTPKPLTSVTTTIQSKPNISDNVHNYETTVYSVKINSDVDLAQKGQKTITNTSAESHKISRYKICNNKFARSIVINELSNDVTSFVTDNQHTTQLERPVNSKVTSKIVNSSDNVPLLKSSHSVSKESLESSYKVFDIVQSATNKNKSILDIFNTNIEVQGSPERNDYSENLSKPYETEWDEDDEALYSETNTCDVSLLSNVMESKGPKIMPCTEKEQATTTEEITFCDVREKQFQLLDMLNNCEEDKERNIIQRTSSPIKEYDMQSNGENNEITIKSHSHLPQISNLVTLPGALPPDVNSEILSISDTPEKKKSQENPPKVISPSKKIYILESVDIKPKNNHNCIVNQEKREIQDVNTNLCGSDISQPLPQDIQSTTTEANKIQDDSKNVQSHESPQKLPLDLLNLLSGVNTDTILLALQNLQQLSHKQSDDNNIEANPKCDKEQPMETINLTNDEDWENESNCDNTIEKQLERMDGNTGDTPFLGDIFDPGPVELPTGVNKKLNLNIKLLDNKDESQKHHLNENAPVIGSFKSFALPKPILLSRLKLTTKAADSKNKNFYGKKIRRKKKSKSSESQNEEQGEAQREDEEDEESGDEADLSKYDLWGSDDEKGNSSKDNADKIKDGENSKGEQESGDNTVASPAKNSERRSRSSSSSSTSSSSSSSSRSSSPAQTKNKFDDFILNSERESTAGSPPSRSRSPRAGRAGAVPQPARRKSRDSRDSRSNEPSRDKERARDRERRDRSRGRSRGEERKERRYARDGGAANHYRHR